MSIFGIILFIVVVAMFAWLLVGVIRDIKAIIKNKRNKSKSSSELTEESKSNIKEDKK